ncbi:MAG: preprotein translocase subunit SecE [Pseudomonadota bacterium]
MANDKTKTVKKVPGKNEDRVDKKDADVKNGSQQGAKGKIKLAVDKSIQFLREVKVEFKKVVWPSRKETFGTTAVVILLVLMIALFLGLVDLVLAKLIGILIK